MMTGDNTEKKWAHQFFAKRNTGVPKTRKIAAGALASDVSPKAPGKVIIIFLKHSKTAIVR